MKAKGCIDDSGGLLGHAYYIFPTNAALSLVGSSKVPMEQPSIRTAPLEAKRGSSPARQVDGVDYKLSAHVLLLLRKLASSHDPGRDYHCMLIVSFAVWMPLYYYVVLP
jgi:hypothetical protein